MIVIDTHCDTLLKISEGRGLWDLGKDAHLDIKRLYQNVKLQVFAVFVETQFRPHRLLAQGLNLIEIFHREMEKNEETIFVVQNKRDLTQLKYTDKVGALLSLEGGDILQGNMSMLYVLFRLGVRSIGLTWNNRNEIADGAGESQTRGGLTKFGIKLIKEINRLGIILDLAHISEAGFWSSLQHSDGPLMVSHANCKSLCPHVRNLSDHQISALAERKGVMGITFVPEFLASGKANLDDVLNHIDHACTIAGADCVGLGSDFDGTDNLPDGLEDVSKIHLIADGLLKRGYSTEDVEKIMGNNFFRLFQEILPD